MYQRRSYEPKKGLRGRMTGGDCPTKRNTLKGTTKASTVEVFTTNTSRDAKTAI